MRAFCTVSAPLEVCASSAEQLSPGSRFLALRLLGNQQQKTLYFLVDAKSRVREVYTQTCLHFSTQGMLDTELFGLAVLMDGEYLFADPESKLSKYGPKSWRSSHTHGLDANGRPLLELYFRVQFYIESPLLLKDETTRHNYYLQLKYNALHRDILCDYSEQSMIFLAGLALQADLGDVSIPYGGVERNSIAAKISCDGKVQNISNKSAEHAFHAKAMPPPKQVTTATTTLPKINKGTNVVHERILRLSSYVSSAHQGSNASDMVSEGSRTAAHKVLKRSLYSVVPLSPASSTSSISRGPSSASTNASTSTNASSRPDYFRLEDYLPPHLRTARAASTLRACHRENRGMSVSDAELHYIQQACMMHECINAHTFRMRLSKNENGPGNSWFVIYAKGIIIFASSGGTTESTSVQQQITFLWPNITKLSFERKKFEIRSGENKITLFATSDEKNKMLLTLCRDTHQFSMKIAARLKEVIKREEDENNCLHACYAYSRSLHLPPYKNKSDQRISVISSTSSNTTSGIVSDRVHSEDELEIMINTPPVPIAAPSTESLALAHLLDQPSVSRQTSSVGQVSLKDLEGHLAALSIRQSETRCSTTHERPDSPTDLNNTSSAGNSSSTSGNSLNTAASKCNTESSTSIESPTSQHNKGSQCSSTCSTVVVASSTSENLSSLATLAVRSNLKAITSSNCNNQRRNSTSSSLELGFSHTAQNSMLSEAESTCIDDDLMRIHHDENESITEVYTMGGGMAPTETSGVYTMNSSELTCQSSEIAESEKSSHYGIFQPTISDISNNHLQDNESNLEDAVDGGGSFRRESEANNEFRRRLNSNVSTSGSFRGDGSDPTENKHNLLTAEELTDLIVGRGIYPNRKTVSSTLDSDCDYVTLPLSITGGSYIQGHRDTAPTEDHVVDLINDLLPTDPPTLPKRIESKNISLFPRLGSPPPYNARHRKTGLCGPPVKTTLNSALVVNSTAIPKDKLLLSSLTPVETRLPPDTSSKTAKRSSSATQVIDPPPYSASIKKSRNPSLIPAVSSSSSFRQMEYLNAVSISRRSTTSPKAEEVTARFITTRPQINILKAHTSFVNENAKPSFAAPTNCSSTASLTASICSHHFSSNLSQQSVSNSNYASGSQNSLNYKQHHHHHLFTGPKIRKQPPSVAHACAAATCAALPNSIGIPMVPYTLHGVHKSMSSLHQQQPELKASPTCVLLPVIKPRQYLPPPPPSLPRQPPPPPPTHFNSLYPSHVARKQLELYQQQLCSDVDYVIYPLQDPAVSQQEYLDAKQGSMIAAMAQCQPSHHHHPYLAAYHNAAATAAWETYKGHAIYRSTPYLPLALSSHSRYASTQNLSDTYVQLPSAYSSIYSPSIGSLCSSYDAPPPPLHPAAMTTAASTIFHPSNAPLYVRSRSDDNILNSLELLPKVKRLPPPPPPPYVNRRLKKAPMPAPTEKPPPIPTKPLQSSTTKCKASMIPDLRTNIISPKPPALEESYLDNQMICSHMMKTSSGAQRMDPIYRGTDSNESSQNFKNITTTIITSTTTMTTITTTTATTTNISLNSAVAAPPNELDIALLREKSKNLDLPLISALCNDRLLLKQTKMLVHPRTPDATTKSTSNALQYNAMNSTEMPNTPSNCLISMENNSTTATLTTMTSPSTQRINSKLLTSAAVSSVVNGKARRTSVSHRHPNDKLPPLPMQMAAANNYVMDPAILKHHKNHNSHA